MRFDKKNNYSIDGSSGEMIDIDDGNESLNPETALWRSVITQALMDAGTNSQKIALRREKAKATSWLAGTSDDFLTVCEMADLDPDYVIEKSLEAIKRGCVWRKTNQNNLCKPKTDHSKIKTDIQKTTCSSKMYKSKKS